MSRTNSTRKSSFSRIIQKGREVRVKHAIVICAIIQMLFEREQKGAKQKSEKLKRKSETRSFNLNRTNTIKPISVQYELIKKPSNINLNTIIFNTNVKKH